MAVMQLSIRKPEWWAKNPTYWHNVSEAVMETLYRRFGMIEHYEVQCGWQLDSFLSDDEVRRLTLHVFGVTLPAMVERVKQLVIVGDGECPDCGSSNRTSIDGGMGRNEYGLYVEAIGWKCNNCGMEDYR
jgi:hypothetical protein